MTADPLEGTPHSMGDPNTSMGPGESIPTMSAQATADSPPNLGNFKGVMLCNRPIDAEADRRGAGQTEGLLPFRAGASTAHCDQLGLAPPHFAALAEDWSKRLAAPTAVLRKHARWLKTFAKRVATKRAQREEAVRNDEEKLKRISEFAAKQRAAIRKVTEIRGELKANDDDDVMKTRPAGKGVEDGSREGECIEQAVNGKGKTSDKRQLKSRPLWSLTEAQARKAAEVDEEELLAFAETVKFDEYINDLEFRTALAVMKDRAGRLHREQESFREALQEAYDREIEEQEARVVDVDDGCDNASDDGVGSISGVGFEDSASQKGRRDSASTSGVSASTTTRDRSRLINGDGRPGWDSKPLPVDDETQSIVSEALKGNQQIRSIHNGRSVRGVLETLSSQSNGPEVPYSVDLPALNPVVVVSEDTNIRKETVIFYLRQRTLEITSLALLLAVACLGIVLLHSVRKVVPSEPPEEPWDSRPTLALGGTGLRIGYAFGCIAALQDYADLSDVRVTTVSGSIFAGFIAAAPQLNMGKMMKALLNVRDHMMSSGLKGCYLLDVDETVDMILEELTRTGGLTHDILKSIASNDQLHIGLTSFCPLPSTRCIHCPDNFEDLHRVMAAAICIPPFFNRFARYEGHLAADGAFSSWFAVPDGCHPGKIVKLSPFFIPWARFRSMFLSTPHDVYECVHPFGLDRQLESFREG
ncbi:hypothetical protein Pmar_PMAR003421 [Perkinsus marinus ATCC 50983]|uniref:PNPLA domain-containing protein n=1 Tax=Perkinsus marinus (strain ATCC 50983 / TXsc) TaxID=423536 RepID=C5KHA0_PERM5|nr:hypothetical protein Pmar_PMAR003421 [Perkinsus marinus ATCC 50983]EER15962.1 hypothetical protein Pmar_PMAR003421 [Perkinsus marinus ATCC 50983]|eukprot:XP_002784166.1 hypothetical protein Pmar_PMAR003421 [Perkinsus marinus ATCC 50983]